MGRQTHTRAGIVTTLRGAAPVIDSYLRHHLDLGFERIYLFFDDPDDPAIDIVAARNDERLVIVANDLALDAAWRRCAQYTYYAPHVAQEVMARQCLNVEVAVQHALADGIDWLLHIDADELFHAPGQKAGEHFATLSAAGVERAVYPNLEAMATTESIGDFFREVTLFKMNRNLLRGGQLSPEQAELVRGVPQIPPTGFLFYSNGKSAARVRPGLVADGVHRFHKTRYPRPDQAAIAAGPAAIERVIGDCFVLHYPCCGLDAIVSKYRILGEFDDRWFNRVDIRSSIGDFHLAARDVVRTGDPARIRAFYRERAMLDDPVLVAKLIAAGVLLRIDAPAQALSA